MTVVEELWMLADELRAIATVGLHWSADDHHNRDRYERVRTAAARLFAFADTRPVEQIEREVFSQITHAAPVPGAEAAVVNAQGQLLLIQRADDRLWALPGGLVEMGETPAGGAARETREEAGVEVEVLDLIGVYDSRFCETRSSIQLYQLVFLCRPVGTVTPSTPDEVLDVGWFAQESVPPLSPGHTVRVPHVFEFLRHRRPYFDRLGAGDP